MHKTFFTATLVMGMFASSATPLLAAVPTPTINRTDEVRMEKIDQRKEQMTAEKEKRVAERCTAAAERSKKVLTHYAENYPKHVEAYKKTDEHVANVITRAKAQGKDTSELETVQKTLAGKVTLLDQQVAAVIAQINVAQGLACGDSQGQFVSEMKKARELTQTAFKTLQEIRAYYQQAVRPAIKRLAAEVRTDAKTTRPAGTN